MHLFNASSLFNEDLGKELLTLMDDPEKVREKIRELKKTLLEFYHFKAYQVPADFTTTSSVIAANHLTDSDAPLIMSYCQQVMHPEGGGDPELFVFAKENCFNGVSIPVELAPVLELERVYAVKRGSLGGAMAAMRAAVSWFGAGEQPKHFLIFPQGTLYDINRDRAEDIESGAFWLARYLGIPVLPAFLEQAVEGAENRLIFGKPISMPRDCRDFEAFKQLWLERVIEAQDALLTLTGIPARAAELDVEHQTRKKFQNSVR